MATQWFYTIGDERFGPVSGTELKVLARTGVLHPADLVFKEGMPDWQPARKVKSLWVSRRSIADGADTPKPPPVPATTPFGAVAPVPPAAQAAAPVREETVPQSSPFMAVPEAPWFPESPPQPGFGEALSGAFAHAGKAASLLIRRPLQLTFFTMTLLVLFASSLAGVITAPLFPLFLMGYLTILKQIVHGEQPSLAAFLAFTRHGVSCLWHLLMLLAAYLVTLAGVTSVVLVIGLILSFIGGTLMVGMATVFRVGDTSHISIPLSDTSTVSPQIGSHQIVGDHAAVPLVPVQFDKAPQNLLASTMGLMQVVMMLLFTTLAVTGFTALQIVFSYLALDVASKNPHLHGAGFVYEAYVETLAMFSRRWMEILLCALLAGAAVFFSNALLLVFGWLLTLIRLNLVAVWLATIAAPLLQLALGLFLIVFQATTCLSLREREAAFAR